MESEGNTTLLATSRIREQLSGSPVIVMQATKHRMCDDASARMRRSRSVGDALPDSLMRTSSVEDNCVLASDSSQVILVEDEHVVE